MTQNEYSPKYFPAELHELILEAPYLAPIFFTLHKFPYNGSTSGAAGKMDKDAAFVPFQLIGKAAFLCRECTRYPVNLK